MTNLNLFTKKNSWKIKVGLYPEKYLVCVYQNYPGQKTEQKEQLFYIGAKCKV
jgi:hypothetical protein